MRSWMDENRITDSEITAAQHRVYLEHKAQIPAPSIFLTVKVLGAEGWYRAAAAQIADMRAEGGGV